MTDINRSHIDHQIHPDLLHHKAADRQALLSVAFSESVDFSEKQEAQAALHRPARRRRRRR